MAGLTRRHYGSAGGVGIRIGLGPGVADPSGVGEASPEGSGVGEGVGVGVSSGAGETVASGVAVSVGEEGGFSSPAVQAPGFEGVSPFSKTSSASRHSFAYTLSGRSNGRRAACR